jgi:methyl acetate hydrolase
MPALTRDVDFYPGTPKGSGISFLINKEETHTGRPAGTLMWAGLCNSYYWVDQRNGLGGVYMTQILPFADHRALPLFYEFEAAVYRQIGTV